MTRNGRGQIGVDPIRADQIATPTAKGINLSEGQKKTNEQQTESESFIKLALLTSWLDTSVKKGKA